MLKSKGRTILLVEDEAILAMAEKVQLEKYGYAVRTVTSGEKAIEALAAAPDIDLILMDINLGDGIDGTEAAELILKNHDIPVVFVSSHTEPEVVEKTEKITSYGYVVKNSSITVLDASIKMAFKLFEANKKEIAKEKALMISEEKYRLISENTSDGIVHFSSAGLIDYASPSYLKQLGYTKLTEMGKGYKAISKEIHPDDRDALFSAIYAAIGNKKEELTYTYRIRHAGGHYIWREDHSNFMYDANGDCRGAYVSCRDITERKNTEAALNESRERLKFALDVSGLGEWEYTLKDNKVYRSPRWAEMLGYTLAEIGESFLQGVDLQHPDDRELVKKAVQDHHEGRTDSFNVEYRMRTKDGNYKWIQDCGKILERDEAGRPLRICGTHADIDERKKAEELLEQDKKRLQNVLYGMNAGTWEWNVKTKKADIDEASAALLGYSLAELGPDVFKSWMELNHPDDIAESNDLLMKHARGETEAYSFESRMKHKNGTWVWIQGRGKAAEWDEAGKPLRILGTYIDSSERKNNELALKESQERLHFALEGSNLGEWDWNLKTGKFKRNGRWSEMLGYSLAEMNDDLQQGIDLQHPDDHEGIWKAVQDHLEGKTDHYSIEYRLKTKSGPYKWIHDCGKIMERDAKGNPLRLCGTHADIDEQKKAGEKIKALLAEKELILKEVHHRIKNSMNTISSLLSFHADISKDNPAGVVLQDAANRIQSVSLLYDTLYSSSDFTDIAIREYLPALIQQIVDSFPNRQLVEIEQTLEDFTLDARRLQALGIIINELITNIMKYAFKRDEHGLISLSAAELNGNVSITIQDNGAGIPESISFENSTGFGLQLVQALALQLNGSIRIDRGNGTKLVLEFVK